MNNLYRLSFTTSIILVTSISTFVAQTRTDSVFLSNLETVNGEYKIKNYVPNTWVYTDIQNFDSGNVVVDIFIFNGKLKGFNIKYVQLVNHLINDTFKYYKYSLQPIPKRETPATVQQIYDNIKSYVKEIEIYKTDRNVSKKSTNKYIISIPLKIRRQETNTYMEYMKREHYASEY